MTLQQSRFLALVSNIDQYKNALSIAQNAEGAGELQTLKTLDSLESRIERLKVTVQEFYTSSGLEALYKSIIDIITNVVGAMNNLPKIGEKFPAAALSIGLGIIGNVKNVLTTLINAIKQTFDNIEEEHKNHGKRTTTQAYKDGKASAEAFARGQKDGASGVEGSAEPSSGEVEKDTRTFLQKYGTALWRGVSVALSATSMSLNTIGLNQYGASTSIDEDLSAAKKLGWGTLVGLGGDVATFATQWITKDYIGAITTAVTGVTKAFAGLSSAISMATPSMERQIELAEKRVQLAHNEAVLARGETNDLQQAIIQLKQLEKQQYSSNEAMEEYINYRNQVATQFPQLIDGYDNEGNAIIDLSDDYLILNNSILKTLRSEQKERKLRVESLNIQQQAAQQMLTSRHFFSGSSTTLPEALRNAFSLNTLHNYETGIHWNPDNKYASVTDIDAFLKFLNDDLEDTSLDDSSTKVQILQTLYPDLMNGIALPDATDAQKVAIEAIASAKTDQDKVEAAARAITLLNDSLSEYYKVQFELANKNYAIITADLNIQESINNKELGNLLTTNKTVAAIYQEMLDNFYETQMFFNEATGSWNLINDAEGSWNILKDLNISYEEFLATQTESFLTQFAILPKKAQDAIENLYNERDTYSSFDVIEAELKKYNVSELYIASFRQSFIDAQEKATQYLQNVQNYYSTHMPDLNLHLDDILNSESAVLQGLPAVIQTWIGSIYENIANQVETGALSIDAANNLSDAYFDLLENIQIIPDENIKKALLQQLSSVDMFDAYAIEDFVKNAEGVPQETAQSLLDWAGQVGKSFLSIRDRAEKNIKDAAEKLTKINQQAINGMDSYDDLDTWLRALRSLNDKSLGIISITNSDLFNFKDGKFIPTAKAVAAYRTSVMEKLNKQQEDYLSILDRIEQEPEILRDWNDNADRPTILDWSESASEAEQRIAEEAAKVWKQVQEEAADNSYYNIQDSFEKLMKERIQELSLGLDANSIERMLNYASGMAVQWVDFLSHNGVTEADLREQLGVAGYTDAMTDAFIASITQGGEAAIRAVEDLYKGKGIKLTTDQRRTLYRATIDPLMSVFDSFDSLSIGQFVDDEVANVISKYGLGRVNGNVIQSLIAPAKAYKIMLDAIAANGQATADEVLKSIAFEKTQTADKLDKVLSGLTGGFDIEEFVNIFGADLAKQFQDDDLFGFNEATGKIVANAGVDISAILRQAGFDDNLINTQAVKDARASIRQSAIDTATKAAQDVASAIDNLAGAQNGDLVDISALIDKYDLKLDDNIIDGVVSIQNGAVEIIRQVIAQIEQSKKEDDKTTELELLKLKDALNSIIAQYTSLVTNGIAGSLTHEGLAQLMGGGFEELKINPAGLQVQETAEGLKFSNDSLLQIYDAVRTTHVKIAEEISNTLIPQMTKTGAVCETIEKTMTHMRDLQQEIAKADDTRKSALSAQLAITREIASQQLADPSSFNFMDRNLPNGMQNAINWWNSGAKAYSAMNKASASGYMAVEDYYNMVTTMSELIQRSNSDIEWMGISAENATTKAAELIQAGFSSFTALDDGEVKISMQKLAEAMGTGAIDMKTGFDEALKIMAQEQVDMLEGQIKMLETFAKIEELGESLETDGVFDFSKLFTDDRTGFTDKGQTFVDQLLQLEGIGDIKIRVGVDGEAISIKDLVKDISKNGYADALTNFIRVAISDGFDGDTIQAQLEKYTDSDGILDVSGLAQELSATETTGVENWTTATEKALDAYKTTVDAQLQELDTILSSYFTKLESNNHKHQGVEPRPIALDDPYGASNADTSVSLAQDNSALLKQHEQDVQEKATLQTTIGDLEAAVQQQQIEHEHQIQTLTEENAALAQEKAQNEAAWAAEKEAMETEAAQSAEAAQAAITNVTNRYLEQETKNQELEENLIKVQNQNRALSLTIADQENLITNLTAERDAAEAALSESQEEVIKLQQKLQEAKEDYARAESNYADAERQLQIQKDQLGNNSSNDVIIADLKEQLNTALNDKNNAEARLQETTALLDHIYDQYDAKNDELLATQIALAEAESQLNNLQRIVAMQQSADLRQQQQQEFGNVATESARWHPNINTANQQPTVIVKEEDNEVGDEHLREAERERLADQLRHREEAQTIKQQAANNLESAQIEQAISYIMDLFKRNHDALIASKDLSNKEAKETYTATYKEIISLMGRETLSALTKEYNRVLDETGSEQNALAEVHRTYLGVIGKEKSNLIALINATNNSNIGINRVGNALNNLAVKVNSTASDISTSIKALNKLNPVLNNPTMVAFGDTSATGNVALAKGTLMGELGPELWVSNGHYHVAGQNGAEFVNLPDDAIVFNHQQTANLLKNGHATRGKAITSEKNAIAQAKGNVNGGPAMVSAKQAAATLRKIQAEWQALIDADARNLGSLAGRGGGGGGGGGNKDWQPKTTSGDIQRWYNLLRQIAKLEEQITYQETLQSKLESDKVARGNELYQSYRKELDLLDAEIRRNNYLAEIQKSWYDAKREELARSDYGRIFTYDEEGLQQYVGNSKPGSGLGLDILENLNRRDIYGKAIDNAATAEAQLRYLQSVGFNIDNLKYNDDGTMIETVGKTGEELADAYVSMMENFWTAVDGWRDELDNLYDSYHEQQEKILTNQQKQNELIQKVIDNQITLENKVLDALTDMRQRMIDELQDQKDALSDAADKYVDGLNDQLSKERDMYSNQKDQDELTKLQRQLAILQRSGGSGSQIRSLQSQIDSKMQDQYFNQQQQQIDAIKEASDAQLERLDRQIELITETLAYEKDNGLLWRDVYAVMEGTPAEITSFITANDKELQAKSALQWEEDTRQTLQEAEIFRAHVVDNMNNNNVEVMQQTTDFSFEMTERFNELIDTTSSGNADIVHAVVSGQSGGGSGGGGGSYGGGSSSKKTAPIVNAKPAEKSYDEAVKFSNDSAKKATTKDSSADTAALETLKQKYIKATQNYYNAIFTEYRGRRGAGVLLNKLKSVVDSGVKTLQYSTTTPILEKNYKNLYEQMDQWYKKLFELDGFSSGGLIDFTGPAMVHGSKTKPESIFSAEDTEFLRTELLSNVRTLPSIVRGFEAILGNYVNSNNYNTISSGSTIEHAEVNMYVQKIDNDYDARRAGERALDAMVRIGRKTGPTSVSRR